MLSQKWVWKAENLLRLKLFLGQPGSENIMHAGKAEANQAYATIKPWCTVN